MKSSLLKNSAILVFSEGTSTFLAAITGLIIPRLLSVSDFGRFSPTLSFAQLMAVVVDSGMGQLIARDIAKDASGSHEDVNQIFSWRLLMIGLALVVTPLLSRLFLPNADSHWTIFWLTAAFQLIVMNNFYCWIFKGAQRVAWGAFLQVAGGLLLLGTCLAALAANRALPQLVAAYLVTGVIMGGLGLYIVRRRLQPLAPTRLSASFFARTLPEIYKIGGIVILGVAFTRLDIILVSRYCGNTEAGLYSAAARLLDGLRLIPMVAFGVYLPAFSSLAGKADLLRQRFTEAIGILVICSILAAVFTSNCAQAVIVHLLGHQYEASADYFGPLAWSSVPMFCNMGMVAFLYSMNDHRTPRYGIMVALAVNAIVNITLLSHGGPIVASWARLLSEGACFSVMAVVLVRRGLVSIENLIVRPGLMVAFCGLVLLFSQDWPIYLRLAATTGVAAIALVFLGLGKLCLSRAGLIAMSPEIER